MIEATEEVPLTFGAADVALIPQAFDEPTSPQERACFEGVVITGPCDSP